MKQCPMCHSEVPDQLEFEERGLSQVVSQCVCSVLDKGPYDPEYHEGMAPRTDALNRSLCNNAPRHQYLMMRAHARALEIELRKAPNDQAHRRQKPQEGNA